MENPFFYIDLFAGCGGLSEGFTSQGNFHGVAHVEWEMPMVNTLRHRLQSKWNIATDEAIKHVIHFDIQQTSALIEGDWSDELRKIYPSNSDLVKNRGLRGIVNDQKIDLIIGGPPCQAYSIAGRAQDRNSMKDDYRNYLFESYVEVVKAFRPKVFVFENVPGMLSATPGDIPVTERVYKAFKEIGYKIQEPSKMSKCVFSMDEFGVPQSRKRLIIIGVSEESKLSFEEFYDALGELKINNKKTVFDAIGNLPTLSDLKPTSDDSLHSLRFRNSRDKDIFKFWVENQMNSKSNEEKISFYNKKMRKSANHAKYRNLDWDKPAPTLVAHLQKDGLMFIHPDKDQSRSISVREAALLQSFPDDFDFIGGMGVCYKMIGNAVPPLFASKLASAITKILTK